MIIYEPFQFKEWQELHDAALSSWLFTYKGIYKEDYIKAFIEKFYSKQGAESIMQWNRENEGWFYVAKDENKIIRYASGRQKGTIWELSRIYLLPEYIGKGIGGNLLSRFEEYIKNKGIRKYFTMVEEKNQIGMAFYVKNGFHHVKDNDNGSEWYMEKSFTRWMNR